MDSLELVNCSVDDLHQIAHAVRGAGLNVEAVYFIKRTSVEDHVEWLIQIVTDADSHEFVYTIVDLRRDGKLPSIDSQIRISSVDKDHVEAKRVLDYARQMGRLPLTIRSVVWQGLYIEFAVVAEVEGLKQDAA